MNTDAETTRAGKEWAKAVRDADRNADRYSRAKADHESAQRRAQAAWDAYRDAQGAEDDR